MAKLADDRYIVISSDGHAGAQMHEYREYLEAKYLDEFDEWAKSYVNPFADLRGADRLPQLGLAAAARRSSRTTASSPRCSSRTPSRRSSRRATSLARPPDARRVRAALGRPPGAQPLDGRLLRRHARPARRHGADLPQRRRRRGRRDPAGRASTGLFGGILLPGVPPDSGLPPLYRARLRADLGRVRRARHADQQPQRRRRRPTPGRYPASMAIFMVELGWFSHRVFWHMVVRRRVRARTRA